MRTFKKLPVFAVWKNVEIFAVPSHQRYSTYVSVLSWRTDWEPCHTLHVANSAVFFYCNNPVFSGECFHDLLLAVVKLDMVVATFFAFLAMARSRVHNIVNLLRILK